MAIYMISAIEIDDPVIYERYSEAAAKALAPFDIEFISRDNDPVVVEGSRPANHLTVVKFQSQEKFEEFYNSEAYQTAIPIRHLSANTKFIMLMKAMP